MLSLNELQDRPEKLIFTDILLENSALIQALLDLLYRHRLPPIYETTLLLHLIDLADKWDVQVVREVVKKHLEAAFYKSSTCLFNLFLVAVKLEDHALAAALIQHEESPDGLRLEGNWKYRFLPVQTYDRQATVEEYSHLPSLYHIESCNYTFLIQLPPRVAWALHKATIMWDHGHVDGYRPHDWAEGTTEQRKKSIAQSFRRIMDAKCAYSTCYLIILELIPDRPPDPPAPGSRGFAPDNSSRKR